MQQILLLNVNAGFPLIPVPVYARERRTDSRYETRRRTTFSPSTGRPGWCTKKPTLECYESRSAVQAGPFQPVRRVPPRRKSAMDRKEGRRGPVE
ncbi:hypothetical protein KM043_009842 [Ampulex compressa]|nr:hypothetical protein KM043_009842 [Ampulex compressa]